MRFDEKPSLREQTRERVAAILLQTVALESVLVDVGGRRAVFDETAKLKLCVLLKLGYTRSMAAAQLGIHRTTVTKAMKSDPEFKQQVLRAEELFDALPLLTIIEAAQKDWRAAVWLKNHHQPHQSVQRRKRRRRNRQSAKEAQADEEAQEITQEQAEQRRLERLWAKEEQEKERERKLRAEEKRRAAERRLKREQAAKEAAPAGTEPG